MVDYGLYISQEKNGNIKYAFVMFHVMEKEYGSRKGAKEVGFGWIFLLRTWFEVQMKESQFKFILIKTKKGNARVIFCSRNNDEYFDFNQIDLGGSPTSTLIWGQLFHTCKSLAVYIKKILNLMYGLLQSVPHISLGFGVATQPYVFFL